MSILVRYVFREFIVPLFYCLTGLVSIYILFELSGSFSRLFEAKLPLSQVLLYFAGYLAPYFHYLAPAALMLATIYTMWMFCRHSEIVAMRASGISFLTIARPVLAVAFAMALFVGYVNECFVPRYAQWAAQAKTTKFKSTQDSQAAHIVFRNACANRTWNIGRVEDLAGFRLADVRVTTDRPGGARLCTVTAERAEHLDGEWWFFGTHVQHYDAAGQEIATLTPALDALSTRAFAEFTETPSDFIMQNRSWRFNSTPDRFRYLATQPELTAERRNELLYDTWAQIVSPFACLIITLLAIPAGIATGRQSVFKGILGALGLYFGFYVATILFMILAKNNLCPAILASILPDLAFLTIGIRAFWKQI